MLILVPCLFLAGCSRGPGDEYVCEQRKAVKAGSYFAKYHLWEAYYNGTHGVDKDRGKANQWLQQIVKDVYVVRFEPAGAFIPRNAGDYVKKLSERMTLQSEQTRIGLAGFLRTKKEGNKLLGSFLTNEPDKLQAYIENNPDVRFISVEPMTPQTFIEYERSIQEAL